MPDAKPPRDAQAWLRILRSERKGCLRSVPDPQIPGDAAAYNAACLLLDAEFEAEITP